MKKKMKLNKLKTLINKQVVTVKETRQKTDMKKLYRIQHREEERQNAKKKQAKEFNEPFWQ